LSLLGREQAFIALPQLEDQIVAAFLIMRLAKTPVLQTCVYRINGISPAGDDLPRWRKWSRRSTDRLGNTEFREWLSHQQSANCSRRCVVPMVWPIKRSNAVRYGQEIIHASEVFDAFHGSIWANPFAGRLRPVPKAGAGSRRGQ
jgi:hypothetical protein